MPDTSRSPNIANFNLIEAPDGPERSGTSFGIFEIYQGFADPSHSPLAESPSNPRPTVRATKKFFHTAKVKIVFQLILRLSF